MQLPSKLFDISMMNSEASCDCLRFLSLLFGFCPVFCLPGASSEACFTVHEYSSSPLLIAMAATTATTTTTTALTLIAITLATPTTTTASAQVKRLESPRFFLCVRVSLLFFFVFSFALLSFLSTSFHPLFFSFLSSSHLEAVGLLFIPCLSILRLSLFFLSALKRRKEKKELMER